MPVTAAADGQALPAGLDLSPARRRLFEAALELFGRRGYHAVSVRDIASSVGLKPMALYAHTPSKQDLLLELVRIAFATHRDRLREALLEVGAEPVTQIRALCRAHVLVHLEHPALARVANREIECLEAEHSEELLRLKADAGRDFLGVLARGQRLGVFAGDDAVLLGYAISSMGIRAPEWWSSYAGGSGEQVADSIADFAVRILTAGRSDLARPS